MAGFGAIFKLKWIIVILSVLFTFGTLVIGVVSGGIHAYKTGEYKPLVDSTVGELIGFDASITDDIEQLQNPNIDPKLADYLRKDIIQSFMLMIGFWFLVYWVFKNIFRIFISESADNAGIQFLLLIISFVIVLISSALYNGFYNDTWSFPFKGVVELIKNYKVLSNVGVETVKEVVNETINGTGV